MAKLIDTGVWIDHFRSREPAVRFIEGLQERPCASVVTIAELVAGARSRAEEDRIAGLSRWVRIIGVDLAIAERAGQHMKHYWASHGLDDIDAIIAATAERHTLRLVTLNIKHFPMFRKLRPPY